MQDDKAVAELPRARHDAYETSRLLRIKRTKRYGFCGSVNRLYG